MALSPAIPETPRYRFTILRAGEFRLDGGSMFGLIPRSVWTRAVQPDEHGRITVQHNCLLLERLDAPAGEVPRRILLECGTGNKLDDKSRAIFAMDNRSILDALAETNTSPDSIDAVVCSHLHFDHAGGLTRLCKPGENPFWSGPASCFSGSRGDHGVALTFPRAAIHAQAREWADAVANRSVMSRTYFADHLEPLKHLGHGKKQHTPGPTLVLSDSPRPFAPGITPGRDDLPNSPVELRMTEIIPGVHVFLVPGHTWGQQATAFTDDRGRTIVFTPDVLPTRWHLGQSYSLGYDVEPYTSMVTRRWLLHEAVRNDWVLCLDHDPSNPLHRVREKGSWYELIEEQP